MFFELVSMQKFFVNRCTYKLAHGIANFYEHWEKKSLSDRQSCPSTAQHVMPKIRVVQPYDNILDYPD